MNPSLTAGSPRHTPEIKEKLRRALKGREGVTQSTLCFKWALTKQTDFGLQSLN